MGKLGALIAVVAVAFLVSGSALQEAEAQTVGWTCLPGFGYSCGGDYQANATVGLPFEWQLRAKCNPGPTVWGSLELQTGRLPPGLDFRYNTDPSVDLGYYDIVGVPTRAGSFSFQILFRGYSCPDSNYNEDYARQYTIVVTGS